MGPILTRSTRSRQLSQDWTLFTDRPDPAALESGRVKNYAERVFDPQTESGPRHRTQSQGPILLRVPRSLLRTALATASMSSPNRTLGAGSDSLVRLGPVIAWPSRPWRSTNRT